MPRTAVSLVGVLLAGLWVVPAEGQQSPSLGADGAVGWGLSARAGVTWFDGEPLGIATAAATLRLTAGLEVGAEAIFGLGSTRFAPAGSGSPSELSAGYGGLLVRWRPAGDAAGLRWGGSLFVGGGRAVVRSPLTDTAVAFENFLALEPRVDLLTYQQRSIRASTAVGYRIASSVDALPGVSVGGFRGPTLTIGVQFVRDP